MTTVSSATSAGVYNYAAPSKSAETPATVKSDAVQKQAVPSPVASSLTSSSNASTSALTYNAAGLMNAFQQASANKPSTGGISQQAAKDAVIAAQNAMNKTLESLMSGSSGDTSTTDIFGLSTDNADSDPFGSSATSNPSSGKSVSSTALAAQNAYLAAQNAVTSSLGSLGSSGNK